MWGGGCGRGGGGGPGVCGGGGGGGGGGGSCVCEGGGWVLGRGGISNIVCPETPYLTSRLNNVEVSNNGLESSIPTCWNLKKHPPPKNHHVTG